MHAAAILISVAGLGVDFGWQSLDDQSVEYIVQVAPSAIAMLQDGETFTSEVPPDLPPVRRIQIRVGTGPLPRDVLPTRRDDVPDEPNATDFGTQPPPTPFDTPRGGRWQRMPELIDEPDEPAEPRVMKDPGADGRLVNHTAPVEAPSSSDRPADDASANDAPKPEERPWVAFGAALLGLFLSLGANGYLGMIAVSAHRRYVALLAETATGRIGDKLASGEED